MADQASPYSLEHWATTDPDRIALVEGDRSVTFGDWNRLGDDLAAGLKARGIGPDDVVVARVQVRIEWALIWAAVSKLGARLLVLNFRLTPSETRYILSDAQAAALICDDADPAPLGAALADSGMKLMAAIDVDAPGFTPFRELFAEDAPALYADGDPTMIVYTSGTTGFPKGVPSAPLTSSPEADAAQRDGVTLITMPLHHASGPKQLLRAKAAGWKTVLVRRFDPEAALRIIQDHKVTQWRAVPTMHKRIAALPAEVSGKYDLSSIRTVSTGGGPAPLSLKEWAVGFYGPGRLIENYGCTETGMLTLLTAAEQAAKGASVGKPYPYVQVEIRDDGGKVLGAGETGAIWAKAPGMITGYLNAGPLGADRMDERGFFKVGDVGRFDEDGYLYLSDRAIDMIVSGGVNIYPAEIEAALMKHPSVQDAAVIGIPNEEFGEEVLAYCEVKPGRQVSEEELRDVCKEELASYKRPRRIEFIEELPRNTMGKILKRELREPFWKDRARNV